MLKDDVQCPYCNEWQKICHDDGYGYSEDEVHEQQCNDCKMNFVYTTSTRFHYEAKQAPAGGSHGET